MAADGVLELLVQTSAIARLAYPGRRFEGYEANQVQVLLALASAGEQSVTALSQLLALDRTTVSHALRRLDADGLVARKQDRSDMRRWLTRLTPRGTALVRAYLKALPPELLERLKR